MNLNSCKTAGEGEAHRCRVEGREEGGDMNTEIKLSSKVSIHLTPSSCSSKCWQTAKFSYFRVFLNSVEMQKCFQHVRNICVCTFVIF